MEVTIVQSSSGAGMTVRVYIERSDCSAGVRSFSARLVAITKALRGVRELLRGASWEVLDLVDIAWLKRLNFIVEYKSRQE